MERTLTPQSARPAAPRSGHLHAVPDRPEEARRTGAAVPVALALGAAALAAAAWLSTALPPTLARIPVAERPAVVERALQTLRGVCGKAERPRDFCLAQARLLAGRPECDGACQELVRAELQLDTAVR